MTKIQYQAERNPDGSLTIHGVPIFVECSRGERVYDREWIETAVEKARQAESEGYLPPLHISHHGGDDARVRPAGFFRISGTGPIQFKGKERFAVFADLTITDPGVEMEVLSKRLPYRSVEIFDPDSPAIDSLALLDHEAPYLELPMLVVANERGLANYQTVASATFSNPWTRTGAESDSPAVASFSRGRSVHLLFQDEPEMTAKKTSPKTTPKNEGKANEPTLFEKDDADKGEEMSDDKDAESEDMEGGESMNVEAICSAIKSGEISVAEMEMILAAISESQGGDEEEIEEREAAPASAPGGEAMSKREAALAGRIAALEARDQKREQEIQRKADVDEAMTRLEGRPLGSGFRSKLEKFHRDHGSEAFASYVDSFSQTFGALPRGKAVGENFASQMSDVPEAAQPFSAMDGETASKAVQFAREHEILASVGGTKMGAAEYVAVNMKRIGVEAPKQSAS